jgi:hypothetical protein
LSILRHKKVLASVNKGKLDLANQPLPNAKKWLFDDDFPSIASKEAELSERKQRTGRKQSLPVSNLKFRP